MVRQAKVIIRINDKMKETFQEYADRLGMTTSGLGSYVIGQWVDMQKANDKDYTPKQAQ